LAREGLRVVVLEAEPPDRVRPGSRAIALMYPTLRRLDKVLPGLRDETQRRGLIQRCADDGRRWGLHNRDISSKALRQMRGTDPVNRVKRQVASRLAPVVWPAGAWLANGPLQVPVPRPGSRQFY
jgi:hypothetical protein